MIRLLSFFLVLLFSANIYAQTLKNSEKVNNWTFSDKQAEAAMFKYSKCLIRDNDREKLVRDYLLIPDGHPDQDNVDSRLIVGKCAPLGSTMRFEGGLFRRSLYTALYVKYFRKTEPTDINVDFEFDYKSETPEKYDAINDAQLALRKISDCTARNDSVAVHNFIVTKLHSKSENRARLDVAKAMGACLHNGSELEFSRSFLKGELAEALYKLRNVSVQSVKEAAE